jgi:hypothetical protein
VGHALLTQVENEIRTRGGRLLIVETSATPAYSLARHLYERSGYRREAVIHNFYAPGDDLMVYVKDVKPDHVGQEETEACQDVPVDMSLQPRISREQMTAYHPLGQQCGSPCV